MKNEFKDILKSKMDEFAHFSYDLSRKFPPEESYNSASQLRRASLSVVLNYIEGYARIKPLVQINFYEISYASLQESKYLIQFVFRRGYINKEDKDKAMGLANAIAAMLWSEIKNLKKAQ